MKNSVFRLWLILVVGMFSPLFGASISLLNPNVQPAPLDRVEDGGVGTISFGLVETSDIAAPAKDSFNTANIRISVELNKLRLIDNDISKIRGELLNYFSVSYDDVANRLMFTQSADFPGFEFSSVDIPVTVTANSSATDNSLNGFNANISANDADTLAGGNAAEFTYTKLRIASAPEITTMDSNPLDTVLTGDSTPDIGGSCEAGLTVTVQVNNQNITPTTVCKADGTFLLTPDQPIAEGQYNMTAIQKGEDTRESEVSLTDILIIDTTAPSAPEVVITEDGNNDGVISELTELNGLINVHITLLSDAKVGDTLRIINPDASTSTVVLTQDILDDGYALTYAVPADNTALNVSATLTDKTSNISAVGSDTATLDRDIPAPTPEITSVDGNTNDTVLTSDNTPTIGGTCEAGYMVTIQVAGSNITPTSVCQADGTFTLVPDVALNEGEHVLTATQVGTNGMVSVKSPVDTLIVDTVEPSIPEVVITEDTNNDGVISIKDELVGEVNVLVTFLSDVKVGDILTVMVSNENAIEVTLTQEMLDNGYALTYTGVVDVSHTVTASLIDEIGNRGLDAADSATVANDKIPDYIPTLNVVGTIISGSSGELDIVIRVAEFLDANNFNGDVKLTIVKNDNLELRFDNTELIRRGSIMQNPLWKFEEITGLYILTYEGNAGIFPEKSISNIGLTGTFTSPISSKGQFPLDITIAGTSGEIELKNNKDSEVIEYNNI